MTAARGSVPLRDMRRRVEDYFAGEEPVRSPAGLALALGVDTAALEAMRESDDGRGRLLRLAMTRLEKEIVENGLRGKSNATMTSFLLKTQFGYREKSGPAKEEAAELPEELKKYAV